MAAGTGTYGQFPLIALVIVDTVAGPAARPRTMPVRASAADCYATRPRGPASLARLRGQLAAAGPPSSAASAAPIAG